MRFLSRYEYLVVMNAGKFSILIHVTPSIPALTRRLEVYINDKQPVYCAKPEEGSGYDDLTFTVWHKISMGKILTNLTNFQQFVNIFPIKILHLATYQ